MTDKIIQHIEESIDLNNDKESHIERKPEKFHPSQLAYPCKRRTYASKLGLERFDMQTLGRFHIGNLVHEWLEQQLGQYYHYEMEKSLTATYSLPEWPTDLPPIEVVGHCDCYDPKQDLIYDFKTTKELKESPPERHRKQLMMYMDMVGVTKGKIIYIKKNDHSIQVSKTVELINSVVDSMIEKANIIRMHIQENGFPTNKSEIPYSKCGTEGNRCVGCYFENEMEFSHL